ncbi:hypothetical protein D3C72_1656810 [compost metagenome]
MDHRRDADLDLGHAELGVVGADAQVARQGEFQPAAQAPAGDAGNHRYRKMPDGVAQVTQVRDEALGAGFVQRGHFGDIRTGHEGAVAGAAQHQHTHRFVVLQVHER